MNRHEGRRRTGESRQLRLYTLAYHRLFDALPTAVELRFLTPEVIIGRTKPSEKTLERATDDIDRAAKGIRASAFPGDPTYRACRYCAYASICPEKRND